MRSKLLTGIALALCITAGEARAQQQIQLYASVTDASGAQPATLEPSDLVVKEGGEEAKVLKAEPVNWPVKVQLLLDNGNGLGAENIRFLREGVTGLIEALPANVEVTIVTTAPQPRFLVRATTDKAAMIDGLSRLAPDLGGGRFVDSLKEATQRIERDKTDHFAVIVSSATSSGDTNVLERDVNQIYQRIQKRPMTIHVVLLNSASSTSSGNQVDIGLALTKGTGGRYESFLIPNKLAELLPEVGKQVAASAAKQSHQFRLTVERPAGKSGAVGQISAGARSGLILQGLSMDGRLP